MPGAMGASERDAGVASSMAAGGRRVSARDVSESYLPCVSPRMQQITARLAAVAATDLPVLIRGEPGTGKSTLAQQLHQDSAHHGTPLIELECAAATSSMVDGLVQCPERTVLLEGIEELRPSEQNRLVCALDPPKPMARLIVTTSDDPAALVARRRLRADLLYRLDVIRLDIPPLRQRPDDIIFLAGHFLTVAGRRFRRRYTLTGDALARLRQHSWPGNVRELRTCLFEAVAEGTYRFLSADDLCLRSESDPEAEMMAALSRLHAERGTKLFAHMQRVLVQWALATCGTRRRPAALLGMSRGSVSTWLRRHELD